MFFSFSSLTSVCKGDVALNVSRTMPALDLTNRKLSIADWASLFVIFSSGWNFAASSSYYSTNKVHEVVTLQILFHCPPKQLKLLPTVNKISNT